jgi:exopolysaccharide biosynthesis polyprenyl glycosylphosphotransferase
MASDLIIAIGIWSVTLRSQWRGLVWETILVITTVGVLTTVTSYSRHLYKARVCAIRSAELAGIAWVVLIDSLGALVVAELVAVHLRTRWLIVTAIVQFLVAALFRGTFSRWLTGQRMAGQFSRDVVLVGDNDEAASLFRLISVHPEAGYRLVGCIGDPEAIPARGITLPWLGPLEGVVQSLGSVKGVVIASSALAPADLNRVVRALCHGGIHVHVSTGLAGISHRRIRPLPLAREPLFYLEPSSLDSSRLAAKRGLDLVLATILLVLSSPLLLLAALAVKLQDRGPVIYRQQRIGLHGRPFGLYKFRTMITDASAQLPALQAQNQRSGPLFKLVRDPRVTRVGRILRASSMDELPQLINVLKGQMSMVGPRPALAEEVAEFDEDLLARHDVRPGLTGLWQVEARDNPSFAAYRRLDLFYLENWSVLFDLAIIGATGGVVLRRACGKAFRRRQTTAVAPSVLD